MPAVSASSHAEVLAFPGSARVRPESAVVRQPFGSTELRREDVAPLEGGRIMVLAQAVGAPRLWGLLLDSALDAFVDGYRRAGAASISARLHQGHLMASHFVRDRTDGLVDRGAADVHLLAVALEDNAVHVLRAGPIHAYMLRRGALHQLGQEDISGPHATLERTRQLAQPESSEGLRKGISTYHAEPLQTADLLFAGTDLICTGPLLAQLGSLFQHERAPGRARAVVDTIASSARERGLGAAACALCLAAP